MRDRFCWVVVTIQLIVLCFFAYCLGVHDEKIGWLEDVQLKNREVLCLKKAEEKAEEKAQEGTNVAPLSMA